jgi:hypothetical protein
LLAAQIPHAVACEQVQYSSDPPRASELIKDAVGGGRGLQLITSTMRAGIANISLLEYDNEIAEAANR